MAEWKAYVDDHLVGTGHVTMGAICAMANGAIYGASDGFSPTPEEVMKIAAAFDDPTPLQAGGIILGGTKYMFIRADDRMIAGKKEKTGLFIVKSETCLIIGTHADHIQGGNCSIVVGNLADYLLNCGY